MSEHKIKVSGFTFIRNAVKYDYPVVEAINSILPLCDDFYVAVGNSDDNTVDVIQNIDKKKIYIIETIWDSSPEANTGGKVFALETNKAFRAIPEDSDWAFYIQGDEAVHEKYLKNLQEAMEKYKNDSLVDGLLFNYLHFYGSYDYVGISPKWYRNEVRVIRNDKSIYSYRDAQGFRKGNDQKLNVKPANAYMYHYGWVKDPRTMLEKMRNSRANYYHIDMPKNTESRQAYDYSNIDALSLFKETHPQVMQERISRKNWQFEYDISFNKLSLKYRAKIFLKDYLGINTFWENYKII
jgi:hypothetical protein